VKTKHNPIFWKRSTTNKGINKPRAKAPVPREHAASSQAAIAPNGGSNAGSRKASTQKVPTTPTAVTPQYKSPAPAASDNATAAPATKRSYKAPRGRGQAAPVKSA
jgi:hypothetical protein